MKLGLIGLGKMGSRIAGKLIKEGHELVVWNRTQTAYELLKSDLPDYKFDIAVSPEELVKKLQTPRIIWIMLPAGETTQNILNEVSGYVEKEDILIDGGNSNYKDTQRRFENFSKNGIRFLGIGVSGGIIAAKTGYPLMVGGDVSAYQYITAILDSLAKPTGGHDYFGEGGAGHFIKMIHNGIEYGIMQSLGEGFEVLEKAPYEFDLLKVAKLWQKGTLVSGFMLDRAADVLAKDPSLSKSSGAIGMASGEGNWAVEQAREENIPVEIIERSLNFRKRSQVDPKIQKSFTAKMISALRNAFGGHSVSQA